MRISFLLLCIGIMSHKGHTGMTSETKHTYPTEPEVHGLEGIELAGCDTDELKKALENGNIDTICKLMRAADPQLRAISSAFSFYRQRLGLIHIAYALGSPQLAACAIDVLQEKTSITDKNGYRPSAYNGIKSGVKLPENVRKKLRQRSAYVQERHISGYQFVLWDEESFYA